MAFQGAILIAIVAWLISGTPAGAEASWWPAALFVLGLLLGFAPLVSVLASLPDSRPLDAWARMRRSTACSWRCGGLGYNSPR